MTTPLEQALAHTLGAAQWAAPEPPPDLVAPATVARTADGRRSAVFRDNTLILLPVSTDFEARAISGDGRTIVGNDLGRVLLLRC